MTVRARQIREDEVTISISIEEDDLSIAGQFPNDPDLVEEIKARLRRGEIWAWCHVTVEARWSARPSDFIQSWTGVASLGACSYKDEAEFKQEGGYYKQMCEEALQNLNERIQRTVASLSELLEVVA